MSWFKVDDGLHASRKFLSIPRRNRFAAIGVWTVAGSWSADQLTNGHVPQYMLAEWSVPPSAAESLVSAGLWEVERDGFVFRNWLEYQPSKQDVDAERAASRERMRELRARRKQPKPQEDAAKEEVFGRTVTNGSENVRNPDPTRPDPTRPDPPKKKSIAHPSDAPSTRDLDVMFDTFWQAWPVKKGKEPARKSFIKAIKAGADMAAIMAGVEAYKAELGSLMGGKTVDGRTPKYAQGWLTDRRWEDEPSSASTDLINAQWDAAMADHKPDPCANGHKWAADGSCVRFPCPAQKETRRNDDD